MAAQTDDLPAPTTATATRIYWADLSVEVGAALVNGGGACYLRLLDLQRDTIFATSSEATGLTGASVALTDDWEENDAAILLQIGTHVATLPGPGWSTMADPEVPYRFTYSAAVWAASGMPEALAAYQEDDTLAISLTLDDGNAPAAPMFADSTGDPQNWVVGTAIADLTVPPAPGNPTPTYAVEGMLPAGLAFDTATRVISGAPTASGTGTIRIRATNSQGSDDWTVNFTIANAPTLNVDVDGPSTVNEDSTATLTATVGGTATGAIAYTWSVESGPGSITGTGNEVTYNAPADVASDTAVTVQVSVTRGGLTETDTHELTVSDVVVPTLSVSISGLDRVEEGGSIDLTTMLGGTATGDATYTWRIEAGAGTIIGSGAEVTYRAPADVLQDTEILVRVTVERESQTATASHAVLVTTPIAPAFADSTGDAQNWVVAVAITTVTVPEASGTPVPTYAVVGNSLPAGLQFDLDTRRITGSPTVPGSGTVQIRATNAEGSDDWTMAYSVAAAPSIDEVSVAIGGQTSVGPAGEVSLVATRGGTLRGAAAYMWEIMSSGIGTLMGDGATATYTAPMTVGSQATVTVRVTLTVGSTTAMDDFEITVETAAVETLTASIRGNQRVVAGDEVALFAEVGGSAGSLGVSYTWSVLESFGSIVGDGLAVLYQSIASASEDTVALIQLEAERSGLTAIAHLAIDVTGVSTVVPSATPRVGTLPYVGRLRLMGPITLGDGPALGESRRITEVTVGLFRSSGGIIRQAGQQEIGEATPLAVPDVNAQSGPEGYPVVTGEVTVPLHDLGTDPTATIQIEQNDPRDLEITYLAVSFDSED